MKNGWLWFILAAALIGFGVSFYLTIQHYTGGIIPCSSFSGCEKVLSSPYAKIFGVPTALLGTVYYLAIFVLGVLVLDRQKALWTRSIRFVATGGFAFTCWLLFVQFVLLQTVCPYCLVSAMCSAVIFTLVWREFIRRN